MINALHRAVLLLHVHYWAIVFCIGLVGVALLALFIWRRRISCRDTRYGQDHKEEIRPTHPKAVNDTREHTGRTVQPTLPGTEESLFGQHKIGPTPSGAPMQLSASVKEGSVQSGVPSVDSGEEAEVRHTELPLRKDNEDTDGLADDTVAINLADSITPVADAPTKTLEEAGSERDKEPEYDELTKTGGITADKEVTTDSTEVGASGQLDSVSSAQPSSVEFWSDQPTKHDDDASVQARATSRQRQPVYQPPVRTAESVRPRGRTSQGETVNSRHRALSMSVRIIFRHRNNWHVSLLPPRSAELGDDVEIKGPNGTEEWNACQDEWYGDIQPSNMHILIEKGAQWESCQTDGNEVRWVLAGREIYVLAPSTTISGYVSAPRLILSEDHLVLCTQRMKEAVRQALSEAGCLEATPVVSCSELLPGWILFQGVRPTVAIEHDDSAGILNILRPIYNIEILFQGGIRLGRSTWLKGYPPDIRIRGTSNTDIEVIIDGRSASADDNGKYKVSNWDEPGLHTVFCGGVSQSYELCDGLQEWEYFKAFEYQVGGQNMIDVSSVMICGPIVKSIGEDCDVVLTPATNTCLLGAVPGHIIISPHSPDVRTSEYLAVAEFPVAWTLPACPLRSNRSATSIRLVRPLAVASGSGSLRIGRQAKLRWCYKILNASRKHLRVEPYNEVALQLWADYKQAARQLWRKLR